MALMVILALMATQTLTKLADFCNSDVGKCRYSALFQRAEAKSDPESFRGHLPDDREDPGVDRDDHDADAALDADEVALGLVDLESGGTDPVHAPGTVGVSRQSVRGPARSHRARASGHGIVTWTAAGA